jgi:hypothetical protein
VRAIVATTDVRPLRSYYRAGTVARFPIATLEGAPQRTDGDGQLLATRAGREDVAALASIEAAVMEFPRSADDYLWLLQEREGYLYRRDDREVGFAFVGRAGSGPLVALAAADQVIRSAHRLRSATRPLRQVGTS